MRKQKHTNAACYLLPTETSMNVDHLTLFQSEETVALLEVFIKEREKNREEEKEKISKRQRKRKKEEADSPILTPPCLSF